MNKNKKVNLFDILGVACNECGGSTLAQNANNQSAQLCDRCYINQELDKLQTMVRENKITK